MIFRILDLLRSLSNSHAAVVNGRAFEFEPIRIVITSEHRLSAQKKKKKKIEKFVVNNSMDRIIDIFGFRNDRDSYFFNVIYELVSKTIKLSVRISAGQ